MISAGMEYADFRDLYYDAAKHYAIAKGGRASEDGYASASTTMLINNRSYFVIFMRDNSNGTSISVRKSSVVEAEIERDFRQMQAPKPSQNAYPSKPDYADEASVRQRSVLDELDDIAVELLSNCADDDSSKKFVDSYYESLDLALKQGNKKTLAIPSWAKREGELKLFLSCVTKKSSRQGVAITYAILMFHNKDTLSMILDCVAQAESQGFDFVKQIGIGVEFIKEAWRSLDDENKNKALSITEEKALEALSGMN